LFLVSLFLGVIFWIVKERKYDEQTRQEASMMRRGRRKGIGAKEREEVNIEII
jgi:nitrogen fixation-related uncharacterized protein